MTDIVKHDGGPVALAPATFDQAQQFAATLSKARGFVPRQLEGQPHAILACIMTGAELGIGPMQALRAIHVIDGRPMLSADLMLALALRAGVRVQWVESTADAARCKLTRAGYPDHAHDFTMADARAAGLAGRGNWKRYPAAMLRARCISAALRAWAPDVLGAGVYVEGEIEAGGFGRPAAPTPAAVEDVTDAEIVDEPITPLRAPEYLSDCQTAEELQAWCRMWGPRLLADAQREKVAEHGEAVGISAEQVAEWLGAEAAE